MLLENMLKELKERYPINASIFTDKRFEWIKRQSNIKKGQIGEALISNALGARKSKSYEYDVETDDKRIEVKLSTLNESGYFKWLSIRIRDDYTHLALVGVMPEEIRLYLIPKAEVKHLKNYAGGKRGNSGIKYLGLKPNHEWLEGYRVCATTPPT